MGLFGSTLADRVDRRGLTQQATRALVFVLTIAAVVALTACAGVTRATASFLGLPLSPAIETAAVAVDQATRGFLSEILVGLTALVGGYTTASVRHKRKHQRSLREHSQSH